MDALFRDSAESSYSSLPSTFTASLRSLLISVRLRLKASTQLSYNGIIQNKKLRTRSLIALLSYQISYNFSIVSHQSANLAFSGLIFFKLLYVSLAKPRSPIFILISNNLSKYLGLLGSTEVAFK